MRNYIKKILPKSEFAKNVLTLMTGTTIAQAIPILISPILTRLYTPKDFGVLALYLSIVSILSVVITGRYELAILLPRKEKNANALTVLIFRISLILSLFFLCVICLFKKTITDYFDLGKLSIWIYIIPLSVFFIGWSQALKYWLNRQGKYSTMAKGRVFQTSTAASFNIFLGFGQFISGGLVLGTVIGQFINTVVFSRPFLKANIFGTTSNSRIRFVAKKYKNFPKITMFSGIINISAKELPKTLIGGIFGIGSLGFFSLAQRMLIIPVSLISTSMTDVFFKYASEQYKANKNAIKIYDRTLKRLFIVSLLPMGVLLFIAPFIFSFIFGEKWRMAGEITQLLIPFYFIYFVGAPLNAMFSIAEKQKLEMVWQALFFLMSVGSILISKYLELDIKQTILNFSLANSLVFIIGIFMTRNIAKGKL